MSHISLSHTTSPVIDTVFLYPASAGTMEGPSSVNGRASGRAARERSDRKRAKKRSRRDLELRFDDLPSPAYDDSFYCVPVDRRWSRSRGLIWGSGYDSSDAAVEWVRRVTSDGRCLDERREQDRRTGVGALGRLPRPPRGHGPRQQPGSSSKHLHWWSIRLIY